MYNQKPLLGTLPNYAQPLTPNVAAWLFNESSGNKIFDIIGRNHGTFGAGAAAPSWIPEGLDFDGGDYIDCGDTPSLNITGAITIVATINPASLNQETGFGPPGIATKYEVAAGERGYTFLFGRDNVGKLAVLFSNPPGNAATEVKTDEIITQANKWYHAALTYNGVDTTKIYLDGVSQNLTGSFSGSINSNSQSVYIGRYRTAQTVYFNGAIGEVMIYNRALSASEIWQLYTEPYCWLSQPMGAELMYAAPPVGAIINQFQKANLGADLYDGVLIA